jgi:Zn-dependent peptidase ImmA (M78 family)
VGVIARAISGFESGEYPPADETLSRIIATLEFPETFFYGEEIEFPDPGGVSFRSMSKMKATQRDMALAQGALARHLCRWLEERFELPTPDGNLIDLRYEPTPGAAAAVLRRLWGLGELSIRNVIHLLEARGVRVFSLSVDAKEVDAFSMWQDGVPYVFLNTHKTSERSRYDAAHELGHLVLHQHGAPKGRQVEVEADRFAAAFLMPESGVIAQAPKYPTIPGLIQNKKKWGVSVSALNRRLHDVQLSSDWNYRSISIEIAKRFGNSEPQGMPRETSLLLAKVFSALYEQGITRPRLAELLAIPPTDLEQLVFGLVMTSIEGGRQGSRGASQPNLVRVK